MVFMRSVKKRLFLPGLYFYPDRGSEYVAKKYQNWLKDQDVIRSMNRNHRMNDNAEMESFFHQYKAGRYHKSEIL